MELKTELTRDEMRTVFARRVKDAYGLTIDEYLDAKQHGSLPQDAQLTSIEVFSGEAARQLEAASQKPEKGNGAVAARNSRDSLMSTQRHLPFVGAIARRLKRTANRPRS